VRGKRMKMRGKRMKREQRKLEGEKDIARLEEVRRRERKT
jgi:hypothetical protein